MDYLQSTLLQDEKIIYGTRPHWIVFAPAVIAFLVTLILLFASSLLGFLDINIAGIHFRNFIAAIAALVTIIYFFKAWIIYRYSEYGITNKRVLMKMGWISRDSLEIFLNKIEAVNVDQTVPGRLLSYGRIIIIGTGGTQDVFYNIPDPLGFRKKVQQQIDLFRQNS